MDVREDLIYGVSWSPRPKRSIFKVKRALKLVNPIHSLFSCAISLPSFLVIQNSKIIFTKNMHGHPLICYLWIQFFTTVKMTYYQGQMSPRAGNPPYFVDFRVSQSTICFGDPKLRHHFCQNISWTSVRPYLQKRSVTTVKRSHFQGQTSLEQINLLFADFCGLQSTIFFGYPKF